MTAESAPTTSESTATTTTTTVAATETPAETTNTNNDESPFLLLEAVRSYLNASELSHQVKEMPSPSGRRSVLITLTLTGTHSSYKTYLDLKEAEQRFSVYIDTPVKIPLAQRPAACEYLMRVNYSLALGNFELDFRDGEVRYRCAIDVEGCPQLSREMIRTNIMVSAATTDRFFPGLMAVVFAHKPPVAAYEKCRAPQASSTSSADRQDSIPVQTTTAQ